MKTAERLLTKIVIIQIFFLLLFQLVFHRLNVLPNVNHLTQYEGVNGKSYSQILEVFRHK
ncbi:MAG: DUF5359 family protein [Bacillota bacterium]|nr:DUF5359 family protein [Bacillota bacterium]